MENRVMGRPPLWVQLPPQSYHDPRSTPPSNFSHWINFVLLWMALDEVIWIEGPITLQTDMTVAAQGVNHLKIAPTSTPPEEVVPAVNGGSPDPLGRLMPWFTPPPLTSFLQKNTLMGDLHHWFEVSLIMCLRWRARGSIGPPLNYYK
jgi:hypothetical protein